MVLLFFTADAPARYHAWDEFVLYNRFTRCEDPVCCFQCMLPGRCAGSLSDVVRGRVEGSSRMVA